jgi:hypothetical protein
VNSAYRWNWPPRDKVALGASLPPASGGWPGTIGGFLWGAATRSQYDQLAFLPRGTRMESYYKGVDHLGAESYQFQSNSAAREVDDLPNTPGDPPTHPPSGPVAPDIIRWEVLPHRYDDGTAGSLAQGEDRSPILRWDSQYTSWDYQQDPVNQALRAMGVRADRYRWLQGLGEGNNIGGHAYAGQLPRERGSNHFPNSDEYNIVDSLRAWYRIMILDQHDRNVTIVDNQDARVTDNWWRAQTDPTDLYGNGTGSSGGDRCLFMSGDDATNILKNPVGGPGGHADQTNLISQVFGVSAVNAAWAGTTSTPFPVVDDRFAAPSTAAGYAGSAVFTYPVDGGCSGLGPNRFDGLTKLGSVTSHASSPSVVGDAALYPGTSELAAIGVVSERDDTVDNDRNKSVVYAFSIQFIRQAGIEPVGNPPTNSSYVRSGVENRMRVLQKFLTGCRAAGAHASTCWPCPNDPALAMSANWSGATADAAYGTATFGPLYPIQDHTTATGVDVPGSSSAPRVNELKGNVPNPFNPETAIRFSSATAGKVTIRIFNVAGQVVTTVTKNVIQGPNEIRWNGRASDGTPLASGIYFYRVRFADGSETASRMALLK